MREPWERQPKEPTYAFNGFTLYRDMGPTRTVRRVTDEIGKSKPTVERWAAKWDWRERAMAWDDEQDRLRRASYQEVVKAMGERHARIALLMMEKAIERIQSMDSDELQPQDISRWVQIAVTIERQAFGEPGEIVKQTGEPQIQNILNDVKVIQSDPDALRDAVHRWEALVLGGRESALEPGESRPHN